MKSLKIIIALLFLLLCFSQCQTRPSAVLEREKMKAVTRDMLMADAYLMDKNVNDSMAVLYYESILEKHRISRAKYDSSLVWYGKHSPEFMKIYDELLAEFQNTSNLLDSAYLDSTTKAKIKFIPPVSDWAMDSRILILPQQKFVSWRVSLPMGTYIAGDTLDFKVKLFPTLKEGEQLISQVFVLDTAYHRKAVLADSITSATQGKSFMQFVIPQNLPFMGSLDFQLVYVNRGAVRSVPLLMDSIWLGKREPVIIETLQDAPSQKDKPKPAGQLESQDLQ